MKNRTVIAILVVAAGLLAFILLFEQGSMTTSELEGRKGRVFVDFRRDAVTALEVRGTGGERVSLERRAGEPDDPAGSERWVITGGARELAADAGAVRQVLSAIDFLLEDRVVREPGALADPSFGLAEPRVEISFSAGGGKTSFKVGGDAPGEKIYLAVEGRDEVIAVERQFLEDVDKTRDALRDKRLVEQPLSSALAVTVTGAGGGLQLSREDGQAPWKVELAGAAVLAAADGVGDLLRELGRLEATRFVADDVADGELAKYGLAPAARTVAVSLDEDGKVELRFGADCEGGPGSIHATVAGSGTVACVDRAIADGLGGGPERFRELKLAPVRADDVDRIRLARGKDELILEREEEDGWKVAGAKDAPDLDGEAVSGLISRLSSARASALAAGGEAVTGLGEPVARVELHLAGDRPPFELLFHPGAEPGTALVRRGDEAALLTVEAGLLDAVHPDLLAFRSRVIVNGEAEDATKLAVEGPVAYALEKKDGTWTLTGPAELAADGTAARQLAGRVARVEAERFAAAAAAPEHGLERPFAKVTATFVEEKPAADGGAATDRTGERRVTVEIGAETPAADGSRFARVAGGDGAVFVLAKAWIDDLTKPPVARDLVQFDGASVEKATWTHPGGTAEATREGEAWTGSATGFDGAAFGRVFADLSSVRALRAAAIGKDAAVAAAGEPRLTLELAPGGGKPIRLFFGGPSDDPAENGVLVRREGVDAAFTIPARILDDLLKAIGLAPPAAPAAPETPLPSPAE